MKKISTFASITAIVMLLIGSVQFATAQKFSFSPSQTMIKDWDGTTDLQFYMKITNLTDGKLSLSWNLIDNTMPKQWLYTICDNAQCYGEFQSNADFEPLEKGGSAFFKFDISPIEGKVASSTVQLGVYETGKPLTAEVVGFSIQSASSVEELASYYAGVSPNPASEQLTISAAAALNSLQIFSAVGMKVMEINNTNNTEVRINIRDLPVGVYYIKAYDIYGKVVVTKFQKF